MRTDPATRRTRPAPALVATGRSLAGGCALPHAGRPPPRCASVSPARYRPGDTLVAAFDPTQQTPCVSRPGADRARGAPPITIAAVPAPFPPRTSSTLIGMPPFTPGALRVDVTFSPPAKPILSMDPSLDPATGAAWFTTRSIPVATRTATRTDGGVTRTRSHGGLCAGTVPVHAPAPAASCNGVPPDLRARTRCNASDLPILATVSGPAGEIARELGAGACFSLDEPGVPGGISGNATISARTRILDPSASCDPLQGATPPRALTTRVVLACGP